MTRLGPPARATASCVAIMLTDPPPPNSSAENAQLFDFRLSDGDTAELDALDRTDGTDRALERTWWRS